jgi:DNA processing protein
MEKVINIKDSRYPKRLKEIKDPPKRLYFKGDWEESIFENCLAVVGSRRITTYGKTITNNLISQIANAGITIVSGFMFGVDAYSHRAAVETGKRTIAVMPCGIDVIHPAYQKDLYEEILENNGLIISELEGNHPPAAWTYPRRNRIVAGLSQATLVIEAAENSGTLITANLTKEYNRKLFAVPGPLTSKTSIGTAKLIKEGAEIVTSADDILKFFNIAKEVNSTPDNKLDSLEQSILEQLNHESLEVDSLARLLNVSVSDLGKALSFMEIKGILFKERGKYHVDQSTVSN